MSRHAIFSPHDVEARIKEGEHLVIYKGAVLQLDTWLSEHPGGSLVIKHMVGRDAADQIDVYHSPQVRRRMLAYRVGRVRVPWKNLGPPIQENNQGNDTPRHEDDQKEVVRSDRDLIADEAVRQERERDIMTYPPLDQVTQNQISERYRALHQSVQDLGFYYCSRAAYAKECLRYSALFSSFLIALHYGWYLVSACFLGLFWHQIMFTAHDACHLAITHNFFKDTVIAIFIGDFCCGLSVGWFKSSHNIHHLVTNLPDHDPDIQNVPLLATSPSFFLSIHSTYYDHTFVWGSFADMAVSVQYYSYYPIMAIARFNLYLLSWKHLLSPRSTNHGAIWWTRPLELVCMSCYWFLFGYCLIWNTIPSWTLRVLFILISHAITIVLHIQFTLGHFAMSTADLGVVESFPQHQLRTTMDIDCATWLDFIHGGLQFQIVHHLFPRVPRHNLRRLQPLVRQFAREIGVEYKILGFVDGNKGILGRLDEIAAQVKILRQCQQNM
ncbi:fatty acid desaturase, partial [Myriangium duriaei CBS 260.36]